MYMYLKKLYNRIKSYCTKTKRIKQLTDTLDKHKFYKLYNNKKLIVFCKKNTIVFLNTKKGYVEIQGIVFEDSEKLNKHLYYLKKLKSYE